MRFIFRSRGWSYEQIWSRQGRWSCSKLWTCDYESQEVANRSYMIVRPVVQGRTINRTWSWADKSCDWSGNWLGDHAIGRAICGTVSRLYYDLLRSFTTGCATLNWSCNQSSFVADFILKGIGSKITLDKCVVQECLKFLLETTVFLPGLTNFTPNFI